MDNYWQTHGIEERVIAILRETRGHPEGHHFGRPFLTAYQLAIEFNRRHPEVAKAMGKQVGGAGIGEHTSLAQYLAGQLSRRIKLGELPMIEGGLLSDTNLKAISFRNGAEIIESSLAGYNFDLSMYRYVGE